MKPLWSWLALGAAGAVAVVIVSAGLLFHRFDAPGPLAGPAIVVVPQGAGVAAVAGLLARHGVIRNALVFEAGVRISGNGGRLRAGEYEFPGYASARDIMDMLTAGRILVRRLTVPEGLTTAQVYELVSIAYGLDGDLGPMPGEGTLLPDTYHYTYGDTRAVLIQRMSQAMTETVARLWRDRASELSLRSPHEAVILASIVERETGQPVERARVAGVFFNRLARNMPLQSDPTVAYGAALDAGMENRVLPRPLSRADLKRSGPYNTYLNRGLPPGAIANPGAAALYAVLHPEKTNALYFVADGTGGHAFAVTLDEHNRNVHRWRRLRSASDAP
jgi:UPF0755 protein